MILFKNIFIFNASTIVDWFWNPIKALNLVDLGCTCYGLIYVGLLSAFVERWHKETNTFCLFVGEMAMNLEDVSCLLHLLIIRHLLAHACSERWVGWVACNDLGFNLDDALTEVQRTRWALVRLSTLEGHFWVIWTDKFNLLLLTRWGDIICKELV